MTVAAGQVVRLGLRVEATVEVRSPSQDRTVDTELTGFRARVEIVGS